MSFLYLKPKYERKAILGYEAVFGSRPNIENPTSYCEKVINRIKYKTDTPLFQTLADKIAVRDYISQVIGDEYLIPLVDTVDNTKDVLDKLEQYKGMVIKPNHGSGMVYLVPNELTSADNKEARKKLNKWMKRDFAKRHGERQYANIPRKLMIEKFVGSRSTLPVDYKIHLFKQQNGEYDYTLETISGRGTEHVESSFFVNNLDVCFIGSYELEDGEKYKVTEALELSKTVLGDLEYARIDWYIFQDAIYFGEVTLTPGAGVDEDINNELNDIMGDFWDLSLVNY